MARVAVGATEAIQVTLGHFSHVSDVESEATRQKWREHYATQEITLPRPERDQRTVDVECQFCGDAVAIDLRGRNETK